jgi:hypothetical protein
MTSTFPNHRILATAHQEHMRVSGVSPLRSRSIPINGGGMRRTASELQLSQEEEVADFRDYIMYSRIVAGICRTQEGTNDFQLKQENNMCLAHVIGTRNDSTKFQQLDMENDNAPQTHVIHSVDDSAEASLREYERLKAKTMATGEPETLQSFLNSTFFENELTTEDDPEDGMFIIDDL